MKKIKSLIIKYASALIAGGLVAIFYLWLNDYFSQVLLVEKLRLLTDAFSIPGILFVMIGFLAWVSTDGFFDMLSFAFSKLGNWLIPFAKRNDESYYDYKMRKSENRLTGYSFLFYTGIMFFAVGVVFMILFFVHY